jgi:hypothetical protein
MTVVVVGLLTVTVQVGSALQVPQVVEELYVSAGSALQVPQVVEELDVVAGSALQVPQEVLLEVLIAASFVGSALQLLQLARLKPLVAELQVELVQVPKPLPKL